MSLKVSELIERLEAIKSHEGDITLHSVFIRRVTMLQVGMKQVPRYAELKINRSSIPLKK